MANGNDIGAALAAFGMGYMGAKKEKKEQKREDDKWQSQLAISIANLRLSQQQEARQREQFNAEVKAKKETIARQGQEDANKGYMSLLEDHQDPVTAYQITQRTHGYAPIMSPEEGAMWQSQLLAGKIQEKKAMSAIESASAGNAAARAAAAQEAVMKRGAVQAVGLNALMKLAEQGKLPFSALPELSKQFSDGTLPPDVSILIDSTFSTAEIGKDFDAAPVQNLVGDGVLSPAQGAAAIAAYKAGTMPPERDAEISSLINKNKETVRIRAAAEELMKNADVPSQVRAAIAADKTGMQAKAFVEHAAEYGLKPPVDSSVVSNALNLRELGADPNAALGGPGATVAAIAGAPQQRDPSLAKDLFNLGAAPEAIQQGSANPNAFTDALGALTGKRDATEGTNQWQKAAEFLNLSPQQKASGMAGPGYQQQAIAATAAGFTTPKESKQGSDAIKDAATKSREIEQLRKNYINPSFVEMTVETDPLTGKKVITPVLDMNGDYTWKPGAEAARANYDRLYKETVGMSNDIATGLR
jgi:hypothetical protein